MRRLSPVLIVSVLASAPWACTEPPKPEKATDLDKIKPQEDEKKEGKLGALPTGAVAVVNGKEISAKTFLAIYDLKVKKYEDRGREIPESADRRYRKSIVERLIYQSVLQQEAEKQGVTHDEKALKDREDQQKRGIRDWDKHLERRGETEESLRNMYLTELLEKALLEKRGDLAVTDEEIDAEYEKVKANHKSDKERVRAQHILIPVGPRQERPRPGEKAEEPTEAQSKQWEADALKKAKEIHKLAAAADADFDALAREHSNGPSAPKGGDLGIFTPDRMVEEFSAAAFKLKPGQVSKPVKTKFGYHIIKVNGKWGPGELPRSALADQIRDRIAQRKLHQGRRSLKETLLAEYEIVDNIKPTLGPEPESRRSKPKAGKDAAANKPKPAEGKSGEAKAEDGKAAPAVAKE